jgi:hypothetical protein
MEESGLVRGWGIAALFVAAYTAGWLVYGGSPSGADTHEAQPLTGNECAAVRVMLEENIPIGPGWRMFESSFEPGAQGVSGRFCRLLTMGTGEHMEGMKIRSAADIADYLAGALRKAGWEEGPFARKFQAEEQGRRVFALEKGRAVCRVTLLTQPVRAVAGGDAKKEDKGAPAALDPHQRSYWIGVDCFKH